MSYGNKATLMSNAGATTGSAVEWLGGQSALFAEATWGGGNVQLQVQTPNGTWVNVTSANLTANGMYVTYLPAGQYRAVSTTSTANYVYLVRINV